MKNNCVIGIPGLPGFPGINGLHGATGATGATGSGTVIFGGTVNSDLLSSQSAVYGISFSGSNQVPMITTGSFTNISSLPPMISLTTGNHIGTTALISPITGNISSLIASIYTEDTDVNSGAITPIIGVYHQPLGSNGQSTSPFYFTGIGSKVITGVIEPANTPALTSTLEMAVGSYPIVAGDRYMFVIATNNWGHITAVSIQMIVNIS
jgi:hypothetical protein